METKFYVCKHCGNVIVRHVDSGMPVSCCGEEMSELVANTFEAATEKHLPVFTKLSNCTYQIKVGSVRHPMLREHHICFIYVEMEDGGMCFNLDGKNDPQVEFCIYKGKPKAIYEYCNLHGLWKTTVE